MRNLSFISIRPASAHVHCKDCWHLDRYFHIKNSFISISGRISFNRAHVTAWPFSSSSLWEKLSVHWLHCGHIDIHRLVIIAGTQQKINTVVVDLIKVISLRSRFMWRQSAGLISQLILPFSAVQFVAKMQEGSIHEPLKLSKADCER